MCHRDGDVQSMWRCETKAKRGEKDKFFSDISSAAQAEKQKHGVKGARSHHSTYTTAMCVSRMDETNDI